MMDNKPVFQFKRKAIVSLFLCGFLTLPVSHVVASVEPEYMQDVNEYLQQGKARSAVITLKNVLQDNPSDANARFALGNIYLSLGNLPAAEKEISDAYLLEPENPEISIALAKVLLQYRKFEKLQNVLSVKDGWSSAFIAEAFALEAQVKIFHGEAGEADRLLLEAAELDPNNTTVLFAKAQLQASLSKPDLAKKDLEQLFNMDPDHVQGLVLQGNLLFLEKKYPAAIKSFEKIIEIQPQIGIANLLLAKALMANEQFDLASQQLKMVLSTAVNHPEANALQAKIDFFNKNYQAATEHAEASLQQIEGDPEILYIAAASYYSLNRYEAALSQINKVLAGNPTHVDSLKLKAAISLKLDLVDDAAKSLSGIKGDAFKESDSQLLTSTGLALLKTNKNELGKRLLKLAAGLNSDDPRVYLGQASIASQEGDREAVISELLIALDKAPDALQTETALILTYLQNNQADFALKHAKNLVVKHPGNPNGATFEGLSYVMMKDYDKAEKSFLNALVVEPGNPNASHNLASLLLRKGASDSEISKVHENVIQYHPENLGSLIELAILDQKSGDVEQATRRLELAIGSHPDALRPRMVLSEFYLKSKQPLKAMAVIDDALALRQDSSDLYILSGNARLRAGQQEKAIEHYKKAIQISPEKTPPYFALAQLYTNLNQFDLALDAVDKVLGLEPDHFGALLIKGRSALKKGDVSEAQSISKHLYKVAPESSYLKEFEAQIAFSDKQFDKAALLYKETLLTRESSQVNVQLASSLWQQNKRSEAISTLAGWLDRFPKDVLNTNVLASYYLADKQVDGAIEQFTNLLVLTPNNAVANNNLSWLLMQRGELTKAEGYAEKALELIPDNPKIIDTLGTILFKKGEFDKAKTLFLNALALDSSNLDIQLHLAQTLLETGEAVKAKNLLTKILSEEYSGVAFVGRGVARKLLSGL